jgi:hypothetical protein
LSRSSLGKVVKKPEEPLNRGDDAEASGQVDIFLILC